MRVQANEQLAKFIDDVDGMHDALLHEAVLIHPGYVREDGCMERDCELPSAHMIFQSQFADIVGVQLTLKQVSIFRIDWRREFKLEGEVMDREIVLYLCGKGLANQSEIRAIEMDYTMLGRESLGPSYRLCRVEL